MLTKEELCKEYREWLIDNYIRVGDFENADFIRFFDNAEPALHDGEPGNDRDDGLVETVFRVRGHFKGVKELFECVAIDRPVYDEDGEIADYIVVGYEVC